MAAVTCPNTITADVVVFDTPVMFNRLGAQNPNWITYALERDVVALTPGTAPGPGNAQLRKDKRLRPMVLRVNEGDCLQVNFKNWLAPAASPFPLADREPAMDGGSPFLLIDDQVAGRNAGFHAKGLQLADGISDDASNTGNNASSLVPPGGSATYKYYAPPGTRGAYLADSYGATFGSDASAGNTGQGMFAAVNVEPKGARWYRSQLTEEEMFLATVGYTAAGQPILDYEMPYPNVEPWIAEGKAGKPILNLRDGNAIFHSDLNAVIAGPNPDGTFPASTYPLESAGKRNPAVPNRLEPFREFTVVFHDEASVGQAFPGFFDDNPVTRRILHGVRDGFLINYGSGGIGSEIIANRLGVGPMWDCLSCSYEEFFLGSSTVGDPAMLVDFPANLGLEGCDIAGNGCDIVGPKATKALFPDDPSNVHHSYQSDRVVFRNLHAGKEHHIFHLHNHQWLFDSNDDNSNYLDAQAIGPGSGYTYEINFGGSGNRNKTAGDAIFHCHFYPHFAQGMWELWRVHDVYETGTRLAVTGEDFHTTPFALWDGTPALHPSAGATLPAGSRVRALPDGEILDGTPIPALVPLPGKALPLMPADVAIVQKNANPGVDEDPFTPGVQEFVDSSQAYVVERDKNPGFPFWIAGVDCGNDPATCPMGVVGQRPPTPVLDMVNEGQSAALRSSNPALFGKLNSMTGNANGGWDGGLPRHSLDGFLAAGGRTIDVYHQEQTKLSFHKEVLKAKAVWFPEGGTDIEQTAMAFHAVRSHPSTAVHLDGTTAPADYVTNGAPPQGGSPYFEPCIDDKGKTLFSGAGAGQWFGADPGSFVNLGTSSFNATNPRVYKGANIQIDAVFNKMGYHYPQQRIISLWQDVAPFISKQKPAEPFIIRNNTLDCTRYLHTNLVPNRFEVDDYQVTTPTDIIGQHIHLPKWDLPSADGSGNGWNYEDGTLSPGSVRERIHAINNYNPTGAGNPANSSGAGANAPLAALAHPFFGGGLGGEYLGARTTIQRWFFDPVLNVKNVDRGLGIIFSHDHFGPSTIQQIGLYATVLAEPKGSKWVHNETGVAMYTRPDGGPTSWQAAILPQSGGAQFEAFREFWFQHSDFQSAYEAGVYIGAGPDGRPNGVLPDANSFRAAINPSVKPLTTPVFPDVMRAAADCGDGTLRPCPEAISADDPGFFVTNYRNEPIGWRVYDPNKVGPDGKLGAQADGRAGDLAFALQSRTDRKIPAFNTALGNTPYPALTGGILPGDPFTPMLRAYSGDLIRIKSQAGGDEEEHNFTMTGVKWLQGGSGHGRAPNSGWRNAQHRGISEQFTFAAPITPLADSLQTLVYADHLYNTSTNVDGWWTGTWGLMRSYNLAQSNLFKLPTTKVPVIPVNGASFNNVCPNTAPVRSYDVTAVLANTALGNAVGAVIPSNINPTTNAGAPLDPADGTLVYNPRPTPLAVPVDDLGIQLPGEVPRQGPLHDPTAILLVRTSDLGADGKLLPDAPVEPLVLRATAGECIAVTLRNRLPAQMPDLPGHFQVMPVVPRDKNDPAGVTYFGNNLLRPSNHVGISPQLVAHDVTKTGLAVGKNIVLPELGIGPLVAPGRTQTFRWYAGDLRAVPAGGSILQRINFVATPIEFGGSNISPADVIKQGTKGLVGALVIGPQGATIAENDRAWDHQQPNPGVTRKTRASGTFNGTIRDFAVIFQKAQNHYYSDGEPAENIGGEAESGDAGGTAINYGTEPMWFRFGLQPRTAFGTAGTPGSFGSVANPEEAYSNLLTGGDPATPVFTAPAGAPVRMHVLGAPGATRGSVFKLHGHLWQRAPYVCPGQNDGLPGLTGKCNWTDFGAASFEPGSRAIGVNPIGMYLGGQESILPGSHFDIVLPGAGLGPTGGAGGVGAVKGDYLFRSQESFGNTQGLWGILRVE
ncbi:MAG: hypothetical protein HZB63_01525 [Deltaproteobacteria bacterium]|nr:hypothetical protein [Deltaproteobacteria bacterium]